MLDAAGIKHGLVFHGSEIRDPGTAPRAVPLLAVPQSDDELTVRLQAANDLLREHLDGYEGPVRHHAGPGRVRREQHWLPLAVDVEGLVSTQPVLEREVPVVLHAPSASALKGSAYVDPVLTDLDARGLIKYQRVQGVPHAELAEMVKNADIVVDQLLLGSYGVFACEAMAAGRVTVGHIADPVRDLLPTDLPIAEANPDDLSEVIERLVAERDRPARSPTRDRRSCVNCTTAGSRSRNCCPSNNESASTTNWCTRTRASNADSDDRAVPDRRGLADPAGGDGARRGRSHAARGRPGRA